MAAILCDHLYIKNHITPNLTVMVHGR